jgi:hypothetical protein
MQATKTAAWTAFVARLQIKLRSKIMCARFTVAGDLSELGKFFDFVCRAAFFAPCYNIAP